MKAWKIRSGMAAALLGAVMGVVPGAAWSAPDIAVRVFPVGGYGGAASPTISADGRYVAYRDAPNASIFVLDLQTGESTQVNRTLTGGLPVSPACDAPAMSADARYVVFGCTAAAMGGKPSNGGDAYFVYDRVNATTEMLQVPDAKTVTRSTPPAISPNGRYIAFRGFTTSSNMTLYVRDMVNKTTLITNAQSLLSGTSMNISDDGRYISYSGRVVPTTTLLTVSLYDTVTGVTEAVNVNTAGVRGTLQASSSNMSGDGNLVAFASAEAALVTPKAPAINTAIFVRDRRAGITELVSGVTTTGVTYNSMNDNGRYVAFVSNAERKLYVYDRLTKISRVVPGAFGNGLVALYSAFSKDGRYLVFQSLHNTAPVSNSLAVADLGVAAGVTLSTSQLALTEGAALALIPWR